MDGKSTLKIYQKEMYICLLIFYWMLKYFKGLPLLLLLTHLAFTGSAQFSEDAKNDTAENRPLKILSWNIKLLPAYFFETQDKYRRVRGMAAEILSIAPDIIVFQEAFHFTARTTLSRLLHEKYPHQYGPSNNQLSVLGNSGVWIVSSIPLTNRHEIKYRTRKGTDALARKGAMLLEGIWHGVTFQIVGTHLQAAGPHELRRAQMIQLHDELLIPWQKEGVPQFICGDMNTCYHHCEEYSEMLMILDAKNEAYPEGNKGTSSDGDVIDYILIRENGLSGINISRDIRHLKHPWSSKKRELSDHLATEAIISFVR